ncbi:MAG TPA: anti-sigma factor [Candidatus Acidoferrum sp.]|nr:anti-sigma factor [Candidatus Acidoferrum sp.]
MTELDCPHCRLEIHGYLDNELDAGAALAVHRHLNGCQACQDYCINMRRTKQLVRDGVQQHQAPRQLRNDILAQIKQREAATGRPSFAALFGQLFAYRTNAVTTFASLAALVIAIVIIALPRSHDDQLGDEIVSEHVRSLLAQRNIDVVSSDRHTVKPWFSGKLDFAPPVYDLKEQGFPLLGGRLDYLQAQPAAALVYEQNKHIIDLFIQPVTASGSKLPPNLKLRGYQLVSWQQDGLQFIAIADMDKEGLTAFSAAFRSAAAGQ